MHLNTQDMSQETVPLITPPTTSTRLNFQSINPTESRTILLLHGGFSSHHEWDLVLATKLLSHYHLLIPDLPLHGSSTSSKIPLTLPSTSALLASLITSHAKNGRADVVGMSLGGFTSIFLALKYPEVIGEGGLFLSGVGVLSRKYPKAGSWKACLLGIVLIVALWIHTHLPKGMREAAARKKGLVINEALNEDMKSALGYDLGQAVTAYLSEDHEGRENWMVRCESVTVRACVVAGVPGDKEEDCRERGRQLRVGNGESKAFKAEGKAHAWNLQSPEVFAKGIRAWIDGEEMPEEYVGIN